MRALIILDSVASLCKACGAGVFQGCSSWGSTKWILAHLMRVDKRLSDCGSECLSKPPAPNAPSVAEDALVIKLMMSTSPLLLHL